VLPDGRPYFVMEFLQGESLEDALETGHVTGREVVLLMRQLCEALGAAHAAGFVHRDLKPENLWIARLPNQEPSLKILDFGIAKNLSVPNAKVTVDGQILGTAQYMAPEQAMATAVDGRTDVYALGVILYRILTGALPFEGETAYAVVTKHVTEAPVPLSRLRPIQPALEAVVLDCLAKNPAQRPASVGDLWARLEPELEDWAGPPVVSPGRSASTGAARQVRPGTSAPTPPIAPTSSRASIPPVSGVAPVQALGKGSGGRTAIVAGAVAIVVVAVGAGILLGRGSSPAPSTPPSGNAVLATHLKAQAAVPILPAPALVPAMPDAQPAARDAGVAPAPAANPAQAPSSEPAKKHHRERRNSEGGEPLPL
jgi:serine/threonine-protein kinase